jgi:hypothetical protein
MCGGHSAYSISDRPERKSSRERPTMSSKVYEAITCLAAST